MENRYSIEEAKQELKNSIRIYNRKDEGGNYILPESHKNPFYLIGAPGIGKTQLVQQTAEELEIGFLAASITHHTRNSVLGLPHIETNAYGSCTGYTMPELFARVYEQCEKGSTEGILLIDEFASMSEALVAPMLAFLQSKCIGSHYLPEGWTLVLCSNPREYNETARTFDAAVMDRVRVMHIEFDQKDFFQYAEAKQFHPAVLSYLKERPEHICFCDTEGEEGRIVTARGWENLSDCIRGYEQLGESVSSRLIAQFIKSDEIAASFFRYYTMVQSKLKETDLSDILENRQSRLLEQRIAVFPYDKKWQLMQLLLLRLVKLAKEPAEHIAFCDYMEEWIRQWERAEKKNSSGLGFGYANFYENVLRNRLNNNGFGVASDMVPKCVRERTVDTLEENAINEILGGLDTKEEPFGRDLFEMQEKQSGGDPFEIQMTNRNVIDLMKKWLDRFKKRTTREVKKLDTAVTGAIGFCERIDDGFLMEPFLLHFNENRALLEVLAVCKNEAYAGKMAGMMDLFDQ